MGIKEAMVTTATKKRRVLTSVYEASWKTPTEHNIRFQKAEVFYAHAHQLYRQVIEDTRKYRYCDFCDDRGNWSQAVKIAASREPAVKINAAKPLRKSWIVVIFMTVGLPIHSKH